MIRTLALIFTALGVIIASFIWFVASWDRDLEDPITFILPEIRPPEGHPSAHAPLHYEVLT